MKIECEFSLRLVTTIVFYFMLIISLAVIIFVIIHFNLKKNEEEPDATTEASLTTTSTDIPTSTSFMTTSFSLNTMLCEGFLCSYGDFQHFSDIDSYEECENACEQTDGCSFVTFLFFRNRPKCYLLLTCEVLLDPCETLSACQSGPKTCQN
jgi:hypothetical protein